MRLTFETTIFATPPFWVDHSLCYLSSGKLLHAITVGSFFTMLSIATLIGTHPLKVPTTVMLFFISLFSQLDARSRFQEYKQVRDQLTEHGPDRRIFKTVANSKCQRDAAMAAARKLGYARHCKVYFTTVGFRWHHLLPDVMKRDPVILFSSVFWRATLFAPAYHSRYPIGRPSAVPIGYPSAKSAGRHGVPGPGQHPLQSDGMTVADSARYVKGP